MYFPSEMRRGNCATPAPQSEIRMEWSGAPPRPIRNIQLWNGVIAVRDVRILGTERRLVRWVLTEVRQI